MQRTISSDTLLASEGRSVNKLWLNSKSLHSALLGRGESLIDLRGSEIAEETSLRVEQKLKLESRGGDWSCRFIPRLRRSLRNLISSVKSCKEHNRITRLAVLASFFKWFGKC